VLPKKKDGLASLESQWAAGATYQKGTPGLLRKLFYPVAAAPAGGTYRTVTAQLRHEKTVIVSLPRFKMEAEFTLKPVLRALGAELAFSDQADFSGIGEEPLKVSEVVHKAFVDVNEEGTEAAAATGGVMCGCAAIMPTQPPIVFKADHPFLFFIRDRNTNAVLFSGRLLEPSKSGSA